MLFSNSCVADCINLKLKYYGEDFKIKADFFKNCTLHKGATLKVHLIQ